MTKSGALPQRSVGTVSNGGVAIDSGLGWEAQKHIANAYIAQLNQVHAFSKLIVTGVDPLKGFMLLRTTIRTT